MATTMFFVTEVVKAATFEDLIFQGWIDMR